MSPHFYLEKRNVLFFLSSLTPRFSVLYRTIPRVFVDGSMTSRVVNPIPRFSGLRPSLTLPFSLYPILTLNGPLFT